MAFQVKMPRLGWTMEKGTLVEWSKQPNEWVETGQVLLLVESDKAIQQVEALESGILYIPPDAPPPGSEVAVGTLLGYLLQDGETPPQPTDTSNAIPDAQPVTNEQAAPVAATDPAGNRSPAISPRARCVAAELAIGISALKGSGRTGRIVERDVRQAAAARVARPAASHLTPVARRVAQELGVNVQELAAQMPGRQIARADVESFADRHAPPVPKVPAAAVPAAPVAKPPEVQIPFTRVRRIVADRMAASAHTAAPVTLTTEADATELVALRARLKAEAENRQEQAPTYNDLLTKIVAQVLTDHPALNARLEGDHIVTSPAIHIGLAVDTERGLLVPVVRDAQTKSVTRITKESAQLIERARSGRLEPDELQGGTFTITNLGMYEIDAFTPIINLPECAILGIGRIIAKPVVVNAQDEVRVRKMVALSLTFDHRVVDGAPAARFLQRIKHEIEYPYWCLVS